MKKWMKKGAALLLALLLMLTGCAAQETPQPTQEPGPAETAAAETSQPDPTAEPAASEPIAQEEETDDRPVGILSEFTATDLDGNVLTSESVFTGYDLTVVNVWGTYCGPCIQALPGLEELDAALEGKNMRVVGLVADAMGIDGSANPVIVDTAKEIMDKTDVSFLQIVPSADLGGLLYQITATPTTFFVDEYGCQVGTAYAGAKSTENWLAIIDETLALKN